MKIVKKNAGALTNFEVLDFLNSRGASKDTTRVIAPIARSEYNVYDYLMETAASTQTRDCVNKFVDKCKDFKVAKAEILNIINIRPASVVELMPIIEKPDDREIDSDGILELVQELLPPLPTVESNKENDQEETEKPDDREIDSDEILELVQELLPPLPTVESNKENDQEETENGEEMEDLNGN